MLTPSGSSQPHPSSRLRSSSRRGWGGTGGRELDLVLHVAGVQVVAVTAEQVEVARDAWRRYGKGRHEAGLSFGDCFAYALARTSGEKLLFVGDDFRRTDVDSASS